MFHTPYFSPSLICFVALNFVTTLIYVSSFPQFCNNTDMFRTPPHNLLEQSDLFGTPSPSPQAQDATMSCGGMCLFV